MAAACLSLQNMRCVEADILDIGVDVMISGPSLPCEGDWPCGFSPQVLPESLRTAVSNIPHIYMVFNTNNNVHNITE